MSKPESLTTGDRRNEQLEAVVAMQTELGEPSIKDAHERLKGIRKALQGTSQFTETLSSPQTFFRARMAEGVNEREDPSAFGIRPEKGTKLGRANLPGQPVFYGCDHIKVTIREIGADTGDEIYIARWDHPGPLNYVSYTLGSNGDGILVKRDHGRIAEALTQGATEQDRKFVRAHLSTCGQLFRHDGIEAHYASSILAHGVLFDDASNIDGIIYPDTFDGTCLNFALRPKAAAGLSLTRVLHMRICCDEGFTPLNYAESTGAAKLHWHAVTPDTSPKNYQLIDPSEPRAVPNA